VLGVVGFPPPTRGCLAWNKRCLWYFVLYKVCLVGFHNYGEVWLKAMCQYLG
jgi:hypothetical protein